MNNRNWHNSAPTSVKNEDIELIIRLTSAQSMRNRSNFDVVRGLTLCVKEERELSLTTGFPLNSQIG
jgi:hypothetical protein